MTYLLNLCELIHIRFFAFMPSSCCAWVEGFPQAQFKGEWITSEIALATHHRSPPTAQIPEAGGDHPSAEWIAWRPSQNPNELMASSRSI
jgi:hypothetical protein